MEEKWKKVVELIDELDSNKEDTFGKGASVDPYTKKQESLMVHLEKNPETIKKIQELGFSIIYPAEVGKKDKEKFDLAEKNTYDIRSQFALIVEKNPEHHSMQLADQITKHYFMLGKYHARDYESRPGGIDINKLIEPMNDGFKKKNQEGYEEALRSAGYTFEKTKNDELSIDTDGQMFPPIPQSKFSKIYNSARGKIMGIFDKIKSLTNAKNKQSTKEKVNYDERNM